MTETLDPYLPMLNIYASIRVYGRGESVEAVFGHVVVGVEPGVMVVRSR
ncbi:hypothetical protein Ae406Ps2_6247 [Pseudonocardia sp. Ae406_Ps2]|nr:hypothetical protein Ae406Ps2_6247 [Pseudonocardia sp. Ae406_Ps2]OLM09825.1 hypothetical protein Ae706Ps2_6287 [Pseudonocardia sp. Ae706_Ps2]